MPRLNPALKALLAVHQKRKAEALDGLPANLTLERLVEDPELAGLPISDAQRALCRAADGLPVVHLDPSRVAYHFGTSDGRPTYEVPERPRIVVVRAGVRSAKSIIGAIAALLWSALTCAFRREPDASKGERPGPDGLVGVRPGELVRALIVAPFKHLSRAPFYHLKNTMMASPKLARLVVRHGAEYIEIQRPSDKAVVRVELVAAAPGGANLRSTWLAGILFDEADFHDDADAAVNLSEQIDAVRPRILPRGQIWVVSSPWEDSGPFHELFTAASGCTAEVFARDRTLAFHSDSLSMNPTLDHTDIASARAADPVMAAREYDAVPLPTGGTSFFDEASIAACFTRREPFNLPPNDQPHWAGSDLGFRKNSSALALARWSAGKTVIAYTEEQIPTKQEPLKPSEVCSSFARTCLLYRAPLVKGDNHYDLTASHEFSKVKSDDGRQITYDLFHPSNENQTQACTELRRRMREGLVEGPADPRLIKQLKDTKMRKAPTGVHVVLPKHGAAHADLMMAVVLAAVQVPLEVQEQRPPRRREGGMRMGGGRGF